MATKKRALGRGLSALLENAETDITSKSASVDNSKTVGSVSLVDLNSIEPNPFQPRTDFEETPLQTLSDSIKEYGLIQPITVRKLGYDRYQIISGERRFRAAKMAGLEQVPVFVRVANDQGMLEMALVENIERQNLDPIEVALAYQRLIDECDLTQEALAGKVGRKRSTITNFLRLLKLPVELQVGLKEGALTMGHARALIALNDPARQLDVFEQILQFDLSVRQVEEVVREGKLPAQRKPVAPRKPSKAELERRFQRMQDQLAQQLMASVSISRNTKGKGKLVIPFDSDDELERIVEQLQG